MELRIPKSVVSGLFVLMIVGIVGQSEVSASWLCTEASSIREGQYITACGIGEGGQEDPARKQATENAFKELDLVCNRSADCKDYLVNIEPLRNECLKQDSGFKCYRAIRAEITGKKRSKQVNADKPQKEAKPSEKNLLSTSDLKQLIKELSRLEKYKVENVSNYSCNFDTERVYENIYKNTGKPDFEKSLKAATVIPFEAYCIRTHTKIISHLIRTKSRSKAYEAFLKGVLSTSFNDQKGAISYVVDYFWRQGPYDDKTFDLIFNLLSRFEPRSMYKLSSMLFHSSPENKQNKAIQSKRLRKVFETAERKGFGFPVKAKSDRMAQTLFRGLHSSESLKAPWLAYEATNKYLKKVPITRGKDHFRRLQKLREVLKEPAKKAKLVGFMGYLFSLEGLEDRLQDAGINLVKDLTRKIEKLDPIIAEEKKQIDEIKSYRTEFLKVNRNNFDRLFSQSKQAHRKREYIHFCLDYQLDCPKTVPTNQDLIARLGSKKKKTVEDALKIIVKKPKLVRAEEKAIYSCLKRFSKKPNYSRSIQRLAVEAFAKSSITNEVIIDELLRLSWDRVYNYEELAQALKKNILPSLLKVATKANHRNQLVAIRMLGDLGGVAKSAIPKLEPMANDKSYSIRNAVQKSIEQIRSDI